MHVLTLPNPDVKASLGLFPIYTPPFGLRLGEVASRHTLPSLTARAVQAAAGGADCWISNPGELGSYGALGRGAPLLVICMGIVIVLKVLVQKGHWEYYA